MIRQISPFYSKTSALNPSPKVFVGLSGGVDSSVSAALLKQAGFKVTGVFIKVWQPDWISCTWKDDRLDAKRVCAKLDIPFVELNLENEYKKEVVDYMINEYKIGKTPNPDVMCNKYVKFGGFYNWAMKHGADYVATGHYARIEHRVEGRGYRQKEKVSDELNPKPHILQVGLDSEKDQSYFLWQIKKEQLSHILFPVGGMLKSEVRKLAKKFDLPTAEKKDSQGLCFLGKVNMKDFLRKYISEKPGNVIDAFGNVVGTHNGAYLYTIGERHGFSVNSDKSNEFPSYVIEKSIENNTITVSNNSKKISSKTSRKNFSIHSVNLLVDSLKVKKKLKARLRYRQPLQDCEVVFSQDYSSASVSFRQNQDGGAAGQSIVIYDGDICVGGGIIK